MTHRFGRIKGSSMLEFTLVGIPVIFLLISIFEISRGMWIYHTLATAVRDGTRFTVVHANDCNLTPSNCAVTVRSIAQRIQQFAVGLPADRLIHVRFTSQTRTISCPTLSDCLKPGAPGDNYWPAAPPGATLDDGGEALMGWVEISAQYSFRSAIAMFWPGAGRGMGFGTFVFPASSREMIEY